MPSVIECLSWRIRAKRTLPFDRENLAELDRGLSAPENGPEAITGWLCAGRCEGCR
jgi:hypothetical protein